MADNTNPNWLAADILLALSGGLPKASATDLGCIRVGSGLAIDSDGILSTNGGGYTLPPATASTLGGIKVGNGLSVTADGTLSYALPVIKAETVNSSIALSLYCNTYKAEITENTVFTFDVSALSSLSNSDIYRFEFIVKMGATVRTITFPQNVTWVGDSPSFNTANKTSRVVFETQDKGLNWIASFNAEY